MPESDAKHWFAALWYGLAFHCEFYALATIDDGGVALSKLLADLCDPRVEKIRA